ncbi:MAG: hypothetical protein RLY89_369 [Bacteroidota bacterium]|jgi:hypothetical protein
MKKLNAIWVITVLLFVFFSSKSYAFEKKDTVRVLFVGNSYVYYNNLAQMIGLITDSMDTKIICKKSTVGAATLGQHWNNARGLKTKQLIATKNFDIVVIQDNSMWPLEHKDSLLINGGLFCKYIREHGAKPYLYNTWAREKTPETQSRINDAYYDLAKSENAINVPVGSSWDLARKTLPSMKLFSEDGSHPSAVGSFLIALNFIKKITGTLPKNYATVYNYFDKDGETFRIMQLTDSEIKSCVSIVNTVIQ